MMSEKKKELYNAFGFNTGSFLLTREAKAFLAEKQICGITMLLIAEG